ncbi:MAG: tetratricopeptide repeat protein [Planctomycetes bacterium]|nr:tetratricopeptide repeat protein [Planctomycetota bacterium]
MKWATPGILEILLITIVAANGSPCAANDRQDLVRGTVGTLLEAGDRELESSCEHDCALAGHARCELRKALSAAEAEFKSANRAGDQAGAARALNHLGVAYHRLGDRPKALDSHLRALGICRELKDERGIATCLHNLGVAALNRGEFAKAVEYFPMALEAAEASGDQKLVASVLSSLADLRQKEHKPEESLELHRRALEINSTLGDKQALAISYLNVGMAHSKLREYNEARNCYDRALALCQECGDRAGEASSLSGIARLHWLQHQHAEALGYEVLALGIREDLGDARAEGLSQLRLGDIYLALGDYGRSAAALHDAATIFRRVGAGDLLKRAEARLTGLNGIARGDAPDLLGDGAASFDDPAAESTAARVVDRNREAPKRARGMEAIGGAGAFATPVTEAKGGLFMTACVLLVVACLLLLCTYKIKPKTRDATDAIFGSLHRRTHSDSWNLTHMR